MVANRRQSKGQQTFCRCAGLARRQLPHVSCPRCEDKEHVAKIVRENIAAKSRLHTDESKLYLAIGDRYLTRTKPSSTALKNTFAMRMAKPSTPIQRKAISRFSSAACVAFISTAKRNIYTAIWRNTTSATITASRLALMIAERAALAVKNAAGKRLTYRGTSEARF